VLQRRLDQRVPIIETDSSAAQMAQLMCIIQQHHHPLQCRSYVVPCILTSSTTGAVRIFPCLNAVMLTIAAAQSAALHCPSLFRCVSARAQPTIQMHSKAP
jgi:hypothetical protein